MPAALVCWGARMIMDAGLAKLLRVLTLVVGTGLMVFGLFVAGLGPPSPEPDIVYTAFRLCAIGLALALMWLAGWLRSQEAFDPANDGRISKSVLRHFVLYVLMSVGVSLLLEVVVMR